MGIKSSNYILHLIKNVSVKGLKDIIEKVIRLLPADENRNENLPRSVVRFRIDVDCNWLAFKLGGGKRPQEAASKVADFLELLRKYGFIVTPICDGELRHHSKRASVERVANNEKNKIKATVARLQLMAVTQQLRADNNMDAEQKENLNKRKEDLDKSVFSLEAKTSSTGLLPSFAADLDAELELQDAYCVNDHNDGKIQKVKVGLFQADPLIARRAVERQSDVILGADTDFFVSIGPHCILIKDFEIKRVRGRQAGNIALMDLQQLQLGCSSAQMRDNIEQALDEEQRNKAVFVNARYPVLDEEVIKLRALVAIILGSDVFIGGVTNIGAKKLYDKIKSLRETHDDDDNAVICDLITWITGVRNTNISRDLLNVYLDSIIFEPANEIDGNGDVVFEDDTEKNFIHK